MKILLLLGLGYVFYRLIWKPDVIEKLKSVQEDEISQGDDFIDYEEVD